MEQLTEDKGQMTIATLSDTRLELTQRHVCIDGVTPIMFDRYAGDKDTRLEWHQKIYVKPGTSTLSIPTLNIVSFFTAHNTNSAPKRLRDVRKYKAIANSILSFTTITAVNGDAEYIPFLRDGEEIQVGTFEEDRDPVSGLKLHQAVARLDKGIPNEKERALLPLPWSLEFMLTIYPNREIKEQEIKNLLAEGGMAIGLGTFRGVFGKFHITKWADA